LGLVLGLLCLTPLSTIFQLYRGDVGNRFAGDLIPNMSSEKRVEEFADYVM
jgi:hypothetical protein